MRHAKHTFKIGRTAGHRRCLIANMLKSLIAHGRIETTVTKAKELRRHADRMVTLAKKNTLASRRQAVANLMIGAERTLIDKLFGDLSQRFATRNGGYTRITRLSQRVGDNAPTCFIEFLPK
jgi:large subunit ribosomal protein L17